MNPKLTVTAAIAVILASVSVYPLIYGLTWFWAGAGAVVIVAAAGILTRLPPAQAGLAAAALALLASCPLLISAAWYGKAAGLVIVAAAAASATRPRIFRALGCILTYLTALLIYLNIAFATAKSLGGIVPTSASLHHLGYLASRGLAARTQVPPVSASAGVILLAAGGIGLVAVLTDLLAVRLRSPALAGLPLLVLYSVPITTNAAQSGIAATLVFCLAVTGYLALLAADGRDRLRVWGRLVNVWQSKDEELAAVPDTRALAASGRRIGLAAVSLAIIIPLLVPGVGLHPIFPGDSGSGGGPGGPVIPLPSPLVKMNDQLRRSAPETVLTYRTSYATPPDQYLQVFVLNYRPSSGKFTLVNPRSGPTVGSGALLAAPGLVAGTRTVTARTEIKLSPGVTGYGSRLSFLPLPYAPETIKVPGSWQEARTTLMVYSAQTSLSGLGYTVTSKEADPTYKTASSLPGYIEHDYLTFPTGPGNKLLNLANEITKGADTPYQKAEDLQNWFWSSHFHYDLNVRLPDSTAGLIKFLFSTRTGYCQQFAFAMAGLARLVGIPSRIAVGYTAGTSEGNGTWKVTTADAHAWPELYIPGSGWVRFEPTPGGAGGQGTATRPPYPGASSSTGGGASGHTPKSSAGLKPTKAGGITGANRAHLRVPAPGGGKVAAAQSATGSSLPLWLIPAVLLGLILIAPRTARTVARRRRWHRASGDAAQAHAAWREFRDDLADFGLGCRASETPRAIDRRVAAALQLDAPSRQALRRVTSAEERARYATVPLQAGTLRADVSTLRRAMSRHASRVERWRARLLPPSALVPARAAWQHALDVFGWLDSVVPRVRASGRDPEHLASGAG
jgi:transglutaminase-like putative cysteine protease